MFRKLKITLLFFCFCNVVFVFSQETKSENQNGYNKFYYPSGRLQSEGNLKEGKPEGFWINYFENGKKKSEGNRKNYQLDSVWNFFNEKGILIQNFNYREGKKEGYKRIFEPDSGKLVSEEHFIADVKDGYSYFYKNGYKYKDIPFIKGKENGVGREYNKEGTIITLTTYKNGFLQREERINRRDQAGKKQGNWKTFFPSGKVFTESKYLDDKLDGYYKEYNEKGDLIKTEKYIDGVLQVNVAELIKLDTKKTFFGNGQVKSSGTYKQGVAEGVTRFYDSVGVITNSQIFKSGVLISEGIYDEKGFQQGPWKEYYLTGELKSEGVYENGKRVGLWKYYHQNKKLEQIGKFNKKGKPDGDWKWYFESGNILREETFINGLPEGEMKEYDDSGVVVTKGNFIEGEKDGFWFLQDGDEREEGKYRGSMKDDLWKYFYSNGKVSHQGKYTEGLENGKHTYYYDNGRVMQEGEFIMGNKEGNWRKYDREGALVTTILFRDNEEIKIDGQKIPMMEESNTTVPEQ
jgi:antitoxin component YwqK of YwqJK toxin-antitoxin module